MKTKRFLGVCLTLCMIFTILSVGMLTAFAADDLTVTIDTGASVTLKDTDSDGYYDIGTADELYAFAAAVNGGNTAINGKLTANIVVNTGVLTEDGELNGTGEGFRVWTPIGTNGKGYDGTFDGNEYTVSGLYFNNDTADYVGVFGWVSGSGTVQNVGVEDFYLNGGDYVGGVVGQNNYGTITNCHSTGTVSGNMYVGGVVGLNKGGTITNCYKTGTVTATYTFVGGVVGNTEGGTITNCYNTGTVTSTSTHVGGVVGETSYQSGAIITNCYNTGTVRGDRQVGGVAGKIYDTLTNCYNTGAVNGSYYIGGVVGYKQAGTLTNCYNIGAVSGTNNYIGGVVGYNQAGTTEYCYYLTGSAGAGSGRDVVASVTSEVTKEQVRAVSGVEGALVDMLDDWVTEQNDEKYKGWHLCSNSSTDYPSLNLEAVNFDKNGFRECGCYQAATDFDDDGYYEISNAGQLYWFAQQVNGGNTNINGKLTANIVVNENLMSKITINEEDGSATINDGETIRPWTPIGICDVSVTPWNTTLCYKGKFDGCGFEISGLYCVSELNDVGLFGYVRSDNETEYTIRNLGVVDSYFRNTKPGGTLPQYLSCGSIVGQCNDTMVDRCYSNSVVVSDHGTAGGIAGQPDGDSSVNNCWFSGKAITSESSNFYAAGIAGLLGKGGSPDATIDNCYNIGTGMYYNICGSSKENRHKSNGTVTNCYGLDTSSTNIYKSGETIKNAQAFASGEVAYLLGEAWGQTIGTDDYPVLDGAKVYTGYNSCAYSETGYTNSANAFTEKPDHDWKDGVCQNGCGDTHSPHTGGSYIVSGNVIVDICTGCGATIGTATLIAEGRAYDGTPFDATVTKDGTLADTEFTVTYCCVGGCIKAGQHTASINLGELVASADFTIEKRELKLKLTDCYKEYDGTDILTRYTVELENFIFYDEGDYIMNDYLDYDDVYDDVDVDAEKLTVTLSDCVPGVYATAKVSGITLTGETAGSYTLAETITDVPISDDWGNLFEIGTATVTITSLNQNVELGAGLDQSSYTVEGLPQGYVLSGVVLEKEGNRINVNAETVVITDADGTDVTAYFSINTYNEGIVTETCVGHTFNTNGFCATGQCQIYEAPEVNDNGTEEEYDDYYEISNAGQLFWFAEYVANISNEANAKLTDNITIPEGKEWTPIYNLYGTFDGNYKTISGLQVSETGGDYIGLLGYVGYWADVRNLHITNSYFIDADATYVGAIVGYHGGGEISNCYTDETVKIETGGVCGALAGYTSYSTVKNCYAQDVLVGNGHYGTFENCYYIGEDDEIDGTTAVTTEKLKSGEVAYLLQSGISGEPIYDEEGYEIGTAEPELIWGQDLSDENSHPVFGGNKVYLSNGIYHNEVKEFAIISNGTDGGKATAAVAIPTAGTYTLVFADYEETRLNNMDFVTVTAESGKTVIIVPSEIDITLGKDDKIMLWQDMTNLVPLCEVYIVQ